MHKDLNILKIGWSMLKKIVVKLRLKYPLGIYCQYGF